MTFFGWLWVGVGKHDGFFGWVWVGVGECDLVLTRCWWVWMSVTYFCLGVGDSG